LFKNKIFFLVYRSEGSIWYIIGSWNKKNLWWIWHGGDQANWNGRRWW